MHYDWKINSSGNCEGCRCYGNQTSCMLCVRAAQSIQKKTPHSKEKVIQSFLSVSGGRWRAVWKNSLTFVPNGVSFGVWQEEVSCVSTEAELDSAEWPECSQSRRDEPQSPDQGPTGWRERRQQARTSLGCPASTYPWSGSFEHEPQQRCNQVFC